MNYEGLATDPTLDKHVVESQEPSLDQIKEAIPPQFLFFEAHRKIGYAKKLIAQYQVTQTNIEATMANPNHGRALGQAITQDADEPLVHEPEILVHLQNALTEVKRRISDLRELVELEPIVVDEPDIEKAAEAALQAANFVFPLDLNNYENIEELHVVLEVKENRLNNLQKPQDPTTAINDLKLSFVNWAEARDLKYAITVIRNEISQRKQGQNNKYPPALRLVTPLTNPRVNVDSQPYSIIDDISMLETRLYVLENRAQTLQKKLLESTLPTEEKTDIEKELHYLQTEEIPVAKQALHNARAQFTSLSSGETDVMPISKVA